MGKLSRLRELRLKKGLRILDVTCATKVHSPTLSSIERGRLAVPASAKETLCSFFGVEPGELFNNNGLAV
ncbi:MAG: helix-turn-helix domain-containing protein [Synergistaceae bacterium]|nr:helix-turn-helix domain-containing protein [Synergistaceae bacterium]